MSRPGLNNPIIYDVECPDGSVIKNGTWQISKKTFHISLEEGSVKFERNKNSSFTVFRKVHLPKGRVYRSIINDVSNKDAADEMENLFNSKKVFSNPKPSKLINQLLELTTEKDSITLDFFAGSGTTAHAVMQLNAEDNGNRQFICVQLPETTDEKSEARKAGYATIFDITRERITRAAAKIKADNPLFAGDVGFKLFETVPVFDGYLDAPDSLTPNLNLFNASSLSVQDLNNLLTTWAVQDGIALTAAMTTLNLAGYKAYQAGEGGRLLYFMHADLTLATIKALLAKIDDDASFTPKHLIVFGYVLQSKIQREMTDAIKQYNNRKEIGLVLDIRF